MTYYLTFILILGVIKYGLSKGHWTQDHLLTFSAAIAVPFFIFAIIFLIKVG